MKRSLKYRLARLAGSDWLMLALGTLVLALLLLSCSDDDDASVRAEETSDCLTFMPGFFTVTDSAAAVTVDLKWDHTTWTLQPDEGTMITAVSPQKGGTDAREGTTSITLTVSANTTTSLRAQDLIATDDRGRVRRFVVRQEAFAGYTTVTVDDAERYQQVVGFGGMCNPYIWTSGNTLTNTNIDRLYSPTAGMGYTILRLMIYADQSAWSKDVSVAQRAQKHGATVFACPWDCNAAWADSVTVYGSQRKHLKPEHYADYARHLTDFVSYMKSKGITLYGITMQNEPNGTFVYWTRDELAAFIRDYGAQIRQSGVHLMAPEPEGVSLPYIRAMVEDESVFANVDVVATHTYTGYIGNDEGPVTYRNYLSELFLQTLRPAGKEWWMTEHLFNDGQDAEDPDERLYARWNYSLTHLAREIHDCMSTHCSAYVYWYLKRFYGLMGDNDARSPVADGEVTANGYILAHYARYASASVRVKADIASPSVDEAEDDALTVTAYRLSDTERTLVLTNPGAQARPVSISGTYAVKAEAETSAENIKMQALETRVTGGKVTLTLPAMSITSVKCIAR